MRKIGCLVRWVLFTLNILVAIGFLISAYSPYISPVSHPLWACAGLFFPFLFLANLLFIFVWVCIKWQYAFFPLLVLVAGWSSIWNYCPLGSEEKPEGGEVIKLLTYNTQDIALTKEYDKQEGNPVLNYLRDSDADIICLQDLESNKLDAHDKTVYNDILKSPREKNIKNGGKHLFHKIAKVVAVRAPQADSVAQAIAVNRTRYMLVCGDFNDSPISYAHRVVGQGLNDVYRKAGRGPGFTYYENRFYFRIDHIFASDAFRILECKIDRSINASDHYPVWCLLEKTK